MADDAERAWDGGGSPMVDPMTAWGAAHGARNGSEPDAAEPSRVSPLILVVLLGLPIGLLILIAVLSQ